MQAKETARPKVLGLSSTHGNRKRQVLLDVEGEEQDVCLHSYSQAAWTLSGIQTFLFNSSNYILKMSFWLLHDKHITTAGLETKISQERLCKFRLWVGGTSNQEQCELECIRTSRSGMGWTQGMRPGGLQGFGLSLDFYLALRGNGSYQFLSLQTFVLALISFPIN